MLKSAEVVATLWGGVWGADTVKGVLGVSSPSSVSLLPEGNSLSPTPTEGRGPGGWLRPGKFRGLIPGDLRFKSGHLRGWKKNPLENATKI